MMNKGFKKIFVIALAFGAIILFGSISLNSILKNKLEKFIQQRLPDNMIRAYDDITVKSFGGSLIVSNASLIIKNRGDGVRHTFINVEKLKISNISYWDYLFHNEIHIGAISLENPKMAYYKDRMIPAVDTVQRAVARIYKPIKIDRVTIEQSKFAMYEKGEDSTKVYANNLSLQVEGILIDNQTVIRKIPFNYSEFKAKSDSVFVKISPYENLTVDDFSIGNQNAFFKKVKLKTKYSKSGLSKIIRNERDHYNLTLESLSIAGFNFGFIQNRFFADSDQVILTRPSVEIFRDKLVADDPTYKPLYSQMLRELPFDLSIDTIKINDALIKYEERVNPENRGGSINFKNLEATISNVGNFYKAPKKTDLKLTAHFMDSTPMKVHWNFDVQNSSEQFLFKADVGPLVAEKMNSFTEPNLKVRLEGHTQKTYFTIDGNNDVANTQLKINYSDFKVAVLQKEDGKKNRLLSAVVNLFISKDSETEENQYREGTATTAREKNKSVFNFLWLSLKDALTKSMTGKNKEEKKN